MRISDWSSDVCSSDLAPGNEAQRQPAVGDLAGEADGRGVAGPQIDRDVRVHVQDRLQRLADAESALAGIGQGYLRSLVGHRLFAAEHLPHDRDIVLDAMAIGRASCRERVCQYV